MSFFSLWSLQGHGLDRRRVDTGLWTSGGPGRGHCPHIWGPACVPLPRPPCLAALIYLKVCNGL